MNTIRTSLFGSLALAGVISLVLGAEQPKPSSQSIKLTGIFDPYETRDTNVTTAVVMKPRPKCGECHAWAVLRQNAEAPRLEFFVAHGRTTNSWTLIGERKDQEVVFAKDKLRLTYSGGCLKGAYEGRMRARVELKAQK